MGLEEDIMNLVAHSHYKRVPNYRDLIHRTNGIYWRIITIGWQTHVYPRKKLFEGCKNIWSKYGPMLKSRRKVFSTRVHVQNASEWWPWTILWNWSTQQLDVGCRWKNIPIVVPGWEDSTIRAILHPIVSKDSSNLPLPKKWDWIHDGLLIGMWKQRR